MSFKKESTCDVVFLLCGWGGERADDGYENINWTWISFQKEREYEKNDDHH